MSDVGWEIAHSVDSHVSECLEGHSLRQGVDRRRSAVAARVEFGRYAQRHASKRGRKRPETIYFLGFTLYCTRNRKGNFRVGLRTEKSRLRRALMRLQDQMRRMRRLAIREQTDRLNQMLRGHSAYYGIAGNIMHHSDPNVQPIPWYRSKYVHPIDSSSRL